jgi:hypothetical protein
MSETCRVYIKINLRNSASRWLLLYQYITIHVSQNVKYRNEPSTFIEHREFIG